MDNVKSMIMIVDDNIANLKIGKNALAEQYVVLTVPSAEKMFGRLLRNKSALIFLDIDMPDVDGYEAIKILKNSSETRDIPVIFLTGKMIPTASRRVLEPVYHLFALSTLSAARQAASSVPKMH